MIYQEQGNGREACVESYKSFVNIATIRDFKEIAPRIHIVNNTAISSYSFEMTYEMKGETFTDTGRDLFVFVREGIKWLVI